MASLLQKMFTQSAPTPVAPGLHRIQTAFVNAYLLGELGGPFILVDTGLYFSADQIKKAVDDIYGVAARPQAIVLTHGHFDHAGSVEELSRYWDVPVYGHPLEVPYLTGMSEYPPQDPTVGGFGGQLSRIYSNKPVNVSERIHQLPEDGTIPGMPEWKWLHTPGHSPGHVSLFREKDTVLLAGDALITMNMHEMGEMISQTPELNGPPEYFTPDWEAALKSIDKLAALRPSILATGHGEPLYYQGLELDLVDFADRYSSPSHGRYVGAPAHCDETGVVSLPPPAEDKLPMIVAGSAAGLLAAITTVGVVRNRRKSSSDHKPERKDRYKVLRTRKVVGKNNNVVLSDEDREEIYLQEKRALEREKEHVKEIERARIKEWEKARAKREKESAKEKEKAEARAREQAKQRAKEKEIERAKAHEREMARQKELEKERAKAQKKAIARAKELAKERARAKKAGKSDWREELKGIFSKDRPNASPKKRETQRSFGLFAGRAPKPKEKTSVLGMFARREAKK